MLEPFVANRLCHSQKTSKACPMYSGQPSGQSPCKVKLWCCN